MQQPEQRLAEFVVAMPSRELPAEAAQVVRQVVAAAVGTGIAGAGEDGIAGLRTLLRQRGGRAEARTLVDGDRLPAVAAAQLNGTMCRALDYCDAMAPGIHIGSSLVPAALAAADLCGGCSGSTLLAALAVGCEVGARMNLGESMYDGFDPTGIAVVFAATAAAARVLGLTRVQAHDALALAFNRCGGSFQSNIDGSLAVRVIQGWVAATGVDCAQLALHGITGPRRFIGGIYGYAHLYGRDRLDPAGIVDGLGADWRLMAMMFKKYPSCGATQGMTELVLQLAAELALTPDDVRAVHVRLPPYAFKLVGHPFRIGDNPRVDAQFSARYCVASALLRRGSALRQFDAAQVADPAVQALVERVSVSADAALDARGHTAVDLELTTTDGTVHRRGLDIAPGFPGNGLDAAQHAARFADCMAHAPRPLPPAQVAAFQRHLAQLEALPDARCLVDALVVPAAGRHDGA